MERQSSRKSFAILTVQGARVNSSIVSAGGQQYFKGPSLCWLRSAASCKVFIVGGAADR